MNNIFMFILFSRIWIEVVFGLAYPPSLNCYAILLTIELLTERVWGLVGYERRMTE